MVCDGKSSLLIDCGFSPAYITKHLRKFSLSLADLSGVFITHTHGDHVNRWTIKKLIEAEVPIYSPPEIAPHLQGRYGDLKHASRIGLLRQLKKADQELQGFLVRHFAVPHDSPGGCFGYSVFSNGNGMTKKITVATDIGYPTDNVLHEFADSDVMVIESNHDMKMLLNSGRPASLIQRIRKIGHLSNDESATFTFDVLRRSKNLPRTILLAHISQRCNTNELALKATRKVISSSEFQTVEVVATHKDRASGVAW